RRPAGDQRAVRLFLGMSSDRSSADRQALRRAHAAAGSRRLRTRHRMVEAAASNRRLKPAEWVALPDEKLLDVRMCDLGGLSISGSDLRRRIRKVERELKRRGLRFRPRYWLSDEWFTPDGVPGVAIPFYLAHPRLAKLEMAQMLEVEGADEATCLRILRHEVGHALDNAYDLRRRPTRRRLFGNPRTEYPEYY